MDMLYVIEKTSLKLNLIALVLILAAGCGQPGGNAPGAPAPSPVPVTSSETAVMKYGESVTTTGGWTVSIDNSDPVENSSLPNGWTVEVLSE